MRFALGTAYGGDSVQVVAMRGDERIERTIKLVGELPLPRVSRNPAMRFLRDILPLTDRRTSEEDDRTRSAKDDAQRPMPEKRRVVIDMVYAGSPAAEAGVQAGDRIIEINDTKVKSIDDAIQALNNVVAEGKVTVRLVRDEGQANRPRAHGRPLAEQRAGRVAAGVRESRRRRRDRRRRNAGETTELKLPEFPHTCHVYVPGSHSASQLARRPALAASAGRCEAGRT